MTFEDYQDPSEWNQASYWHHPVEDMEPLPEDTEKFTNHQVICRLMLVIGRRKSPVERSKVTNGIAIICGGAICDAFGITQSQMAKEYGVTRQAISKFLRELRRELGMSINGNFKSSSATIAYKQYNKKSRAK